MKIFDTHSHYDDEQFDEDREELIAKFSENNIIGAINVGADMKTSRNTVELVKRYDEFYGAVGVHPSEAHQINEASLNELREMTKHEKIIAIGEIGLDYYWEQNPSREVQMDAFRLQMKLAEELNMQVIIHNRDAHKDTLDILKEFPTVKGIVHCFSGSVEFARDCVKLGYFLGIGGTVTFKNAKKMVDVVRDIPLENLVVETDCPYMAPVPMRGKRNDSQYIPYVIEKIAEIKSMEVGEVNNLLLENVGKLLNKNM